MINQFISIQSSSAINTNICEDESVDTNAKASNRMCATNDGAGIGDAECNKIGLTSATTQLSEVSNNQFSDGQSKYGTVNATMESMTATKAEMKINFSVDRLLSKISVDNEKNLNSNKSNLGRNGQKSVLTIDQLLSKSTGSDQQQPNKQIVRPMPMRYLQSTTTPAAGKSYRCSSPIMPKIRSGGIPSNGKHDVFSFRVLGNKIKSNQMNFNRETTDEKKTLRISPRVFSSSVFFSVVRSHFFIRHKFSIDQIQHIHVMSFSLPSSSENGDKNRFFFALFLFQTNIRG